MTREREPRSLIQFPRFNIPSLFWTEEGDFGTFDFTNTGLTVSEDNTNINVEAMLPGLTEKDIEVTFEKGVLWIRGQKKEEETDKNKKYYQRATRTFSYRFTVPGDYDETQEPQATLKEGVLTLTFPKKKQAQPKRINITKK